MNWIKKISIILPALIGVFFFIPKTHATIPTEAFGINTIQRLPDQNYKYDMWCKDTVGLGSTEDWVFEGRSTDTNGFVYYQYDEVNGLSNGVTFKSNHYSSACFNTASSSASYQIPIAIPTIADGYKLWVISNTTTWVSPGVVTWQTSTTTKSINNATTTTESYSYGGVTYELTSINSSGLFSYSTEGNLKEFSINDVSDDFRLYALIYTDKNLHQIDTSNELIEYLNDLYDSAGGQSLTSSNYITLISPENLYEGVNPSKFIVNNYVSTTTEDQILKIQVSVATTTETLFDGYLQPFVNIQNGSYCFTPCTLGIADTIINGIPQLPTGDYVVQARIIRESYGLELLEVVAISSIHYITINDAQNPLFTEDGEFISTLSSTTTGSVFDQCEQAGGGLFQAGICNLLGILLAPSQASLNELRNQLLVMQTIFPFNILFNFNNTVQEVLQTDTTGINFSLPLPLPSGASVVLLTHTQLTDTLGSATKNKWFELQSNFMWVALGILVVRKIKTEV